MGKPAPAWSAGSPGWKTNTYTDAPASVEVMPGGLVGADRACNFLIHWAARSLHNPEAPGTLAVRWGSNGQRLFESEGSRYAVDGSCYLLFNEGQPLATIIESETPVECYTVAFASSMASDVLRALVTPADRLLDHPSDGCQPVHFVTRSHPHDRIVSPVLARLQSLRDTEVATHGWFEEQFHELVVAMLRAHRNVMAEVARVPAARAATREETYRRLHRARDFIEASLSEPLTIDRIAGEAWLSPHHFLRQFKQAFGETPHQYLTRRRLDQARHLLTRTDLPVTEVCYSVGFSSLGSFSWLFHRRVGRSPDQFRRAAQRQANQMLP